MNENQNLTECPNCNEKLKSGWSTNLLVAQTDTNFLNEILGKTNDAYCDKCSKNLIKEALKTYKAEKELINDFLTNNISVIPILTTHTPFGWEYEAISIVTGQSVTGTGLFSEITSDFTDFFGSQSGSFNSKLDKGEQLCFAQLRTKALQLNANAIIATDIDYGEVGSVKGMLMVCAAGTAVRLKNKAVLGDNIKIIEELTDKMTRLIKLNMMKLPMIMA